MFQCCCVTGDEGIVEDPVKADPASEAYIDDRQGFADVKSLTEPRGMFDTTGAENFVDDPRIDEPNSNVGGFLFRIQRVHIQEPLGAILDMQGLGEIHVCAMMPPESAVSRANKSVAADCQMQVGDYITHVNGVCGDTNQMIEELASQLRLDLRLTKPLLFPVQVNKAEGNMGCRISYDADNGASLVVETISEGGIIDRWNSAAMADQRIIEGDRIVAVDGTAGKAVDLLEKIQAASGILQLQMSRPSRPK